MAKDSANSSVPRKGFSCPLSTLILWHHGLIYKECPLVPSQRDMNECKGCKLRVDQQWEENKETWEDKPVKRKKRRPRRKRKQGDKK